MSENPLPSGFLSRHGVKEKHQPLYQKLVLTMAQKERFVSPHSTLVGPLGSNAALRPYSPPRGSNPSAPPNFLCKNKRDSDFSKSLSWRRRRDLNPRAAYRSLLPSQGSPFGLLGTSARPICYAIRHKKWRRERDSNPRYLTVSLVFKTSAINHSAISPVCLNQRYLL